MVIDAQVNMLIGKYAIPNAEEFTQKLQARIDKARAESTPVIHVLNDVEEGWPVDQFDPVFKPTESELVIWKALPSVFESNPNFATELKELGYDELELIGMQSDLCLRESALDAVKLGFSVSAPKGLHSTYDNDGKTAAQIAEEAQAEFTQAGITG
ncbi:MAG: hypothetical protein RL556_503 [Actinomycetota bacterium]